jgi:hypothetical protein
MVRTVPIGTTGQEGQQLKLPDSLLNSKQYLDFFVAESGKKFLTTWTIYASIS